MQALGGIIRPACLLALLLPVALLSPSRLHAEPIILEIHVNQQPRGGFFVEATDDGRYLFTAEDLQSLGIPTPPGEGLLIDGNPFFELPSGQGFTLKLDPATLTLDIAVPPELLPETRINFKHPRPNNVLEPEENGGFFNYDLTVTGDDDDALRRVDFRHDLAVRRGKGLFITDGNAYSSDADSKYLRLQTSFIYDRRDTYQRGTLGDMMADSGPLGSRVPLAGGGITKIYAMAPDFIAYPPILFQGESATPAEVEVYLDGFLVKREKIPPGPFYLDNITRSGGAGELEVVITDSTGARRSIRHPFYLADTLLRRDTHEYGYALGTLREEFGSESFSYGDAAFSAFHRYGWSDTLTPGLSLEASGEFVHLAPRLTWKWKSYGAVDLAVATSFGSSSNSGYAWSADYSYRDRHFSAGFRVKGFSENFARLQYLLQEERPELQSQLRVGYGTSELGSLSASMSRVSRYIGGDETIYAASYNRRLHRDLSMSLNLSRFDREIDEETVVQFGLTWTPRRRHQVTTRLESREESTLAAVGIQHDPPTGEGYGYRAALEWQDNDSSGTLYNLDSSGQLNRRYGVARGGLETGSREGDFVYSYLAGWSGSLTYLGKAWHVGRPIRDAYTLVKIGDLAGVRVMRNADVIGTTGADGTLLVPEMSSYYDNQITLASEDIPIDYIIPTLLQYVSPPLRGGACLTVPVQKIRPIVGRMLVSSSGRNLPLEFQAFTARMGDRVLNTQTGQDGEFYIDMSEAGDGQKVQLGCDKMADRAISTQGRELLIETSFRGSTLQFPLLPTVNDEFFIEMGDVVVPLSEGSSPLKSEGQEP